MAVVACDSRHRLLSSRVLTVRSVDRLFTDLVSLSKASLADQYYAAELVGQQATTVLKTKRPDREDRNLFECPPGARGSAACHWGGA
jgi:hypothetical protein